MSQNVNVNLTPGGYPKEFHVSQYDVGRQLVAKVVDSTGDYSIPSGATVVLVGTKPSGFGFSLNGTVSGSTVTFSTTATVTAEYGRIPCELRITSGDTVLGTANLMLIVEESPHQEGVIDGNSETVIPELTILVERVEAAASNVLDMQVEADTLPAGSSATYSYDEETNTATFGIPQGEAGAGAAGVVASAYSASSTYAVGDYVIHDGNLYRCTTAITTAEAFTAAHWTQVVLGDDVSNLKSEVNKYSHKISVHFDEAGGKSVPYTFKAGKKYLLTNTSGLINAVTRASKSGTTIETIAMSLSRDASFIATQDANYLYIYANGQDDVTMEERGLLDDKLNNFEGSISETISVIKANANKIYSGTWDGANSTSADDLRIRWGIVNDRPEVRSGDIILADMGDLYITFSIYDSSGNRLERLTGWQTGKIEYSVSNNGYLQATFANGSDYGSSTPISVSDFDADVMIVSVGKTLNRMIDNLEEEITAIDKTLSLNNAKEIDATVTENTSYAFQCDIPKGATVIFENNQDSSPCTLNVSNGTTEQNIFSNVVPNRILTFEAPFDIVSMRSFVAGTKYKVKISYIYKAIGEINSIIHATNLPYYEDEIDDTVNKIVEACEGKSIVFPIITDSHSYIQSFDNWSATVNNLFRLNNRCRVDFIAHLGDVVEGDTEKAVTESYMQKTVASLLSISPNVITLTGNHEDNHVYFNSNNTGLISDSERYSLLNRYNDIYVHRTGNKQYFYFDFPTMEIRVICLNGLLGDGYPTGNAGTAWGYTTEQVEWVRDIALDTNYHVIFMSHMPLSSIYARSYESGYVIANSSELKSVISDYIANGGIVVGFFNGHTHMDFMAVNDIGIHEVQTGCQNIKASPAAGQKSYNDGAYTPYVPDRVSQHVNQELWDVVVVQTEERMVKIIRFGAGSDREFSY